MDTSHSRDTQKNPIEALSKDELISKYKGLLGIAKKAKLAKDELTEENRQLKEALAKLATKQSSLPAMQEMLQDFTDKNLVLMEQLNSLQRRTKEDAERLEMFQIENESLKRQLGRLSDENDNLLADVERMEQAMHQVNSLSNEQRKNIEFLEEDIVKIKEVESENGILKQQVENAAEESRLRVKELNELQEKYESVKQLNSEQRKKFNTLKDRFIDVHRKLKNLKECKCVLLETQHEYAASVSKWQQEIIKASQLLCGKMTTLQEENLQLKHQLNAANATPNQVSLNSQKVLQKVYEMERLATLAKQQQAHKQQAQPSKIPLDIDSLLNKLNNVERLTNIIREQQITAKTPTMKPENSSFNVSYISEKINQVQRLVHIIQKERSDQLSTQTLMQQKYERENVQLETSCVELRQHNDDLQSRYQLKEHEHAELLAEMRELNEALKARGDVISRMQEQHDKGHKELQILTETLTEKSQQLQQAQSRIDELEQHEQNADAQSDVLSTSTISRAEELSRLRELDDGYEEKYNKLRTLTVKLKKKLQEQMQQIKDMEQAGSAKLETELEAIKVARTQLQQDLNMARAENQKLKSKDKAKSSNVLNLEIEAAEKSLAEVSSKLLAKTSQLNALTETLVSKENTIMQMRQEISIMEEAQRGEAAHSKQLKQQIDLMQAQIKDAVHGKQQTLSDNKELEQNVEQQKQQVEQMRLQLADNTKQYESKLKHSQDMLLNCTQQLEMRMNALAELETSLRNTNRSNEQLQAEYSEYKIKAQSVLRKQQNRDTAKEQDLETELTAMRTMEQQLRNSNEASTKRITQLETQLDDIQRDNSHLQQRRQELVSVSDDLREQIDTLTQDNQRHLQQQQQQLQQHRQQIEQMDDVHQLQVSKLQHQIEQLEKTLSTSIQTVAPIAAPISKASVDLPSTEQSKIDYLLDHDGSAETLAQLAAQRKISTASRRSHDFIPLDELLNTSIHSINSDKVTTFSNFGRSVSMQDDESELDVSGEAQAALLATKERLSIQESRVRHLTALLAENEQDLAKLTQMNDMLKEELRRQERSEEREQHMHNSEYLKNVFLKFITLSNTDERQRLVPVLNTILRLSRNEMEMLNAVAKGQKVSNDSSNRSWSGFLSAWSGSGSNTSGNNN
ncbi:GRIP and coiled-coil domain-containing protein 2 [Drosophila sulfurigaster albostrigata]|uniref:GRIP and coiled-coil domain-containing protein 2 n=1 Tax=Drosophila sulfurigaster albostrigata TaxID=89887 RepID=UPI002D21EC65|nr:GRIP and coiled-coil domain-containing protein 2 [Drosophila sulfurigaster albostrigata]